MTRLQHAILLTFSFGGLAVVDVMVFSIWYQTFLVGQYWLNAPLWLTIVVGLHPFAILAFTTWCAFSLTRVSKELR